MIFLDSWVWLEFLLSGDREVRAEKFIQRAADEGGLIAPTVVAEVSYRIQVLDGEESAADAIRAIHAFEHIESVPLVDELAEYAAKLRFKYYQRGDRELSYADAIHLAVAIAHDACHALCSGDPDFEDIEEIETIVL